MIAHPPSFNLYQYYFKTFLTFEASVQIEEIIKFTEVQEVKKYLQSFDKLMSFEDAIYQGLPLKKNFTSMDFLAMAMVEMTKGSLEQSSGESES
jgi:hypothetical protein